MNTPIAKAQFVLETLEELIADPQIDFGPAYEGAKRRKEEAIAIMQEVIAQLKRNKQRSSQ